MKTVTQLHAEAPAVLKGVTAVPVMRSDWLDGVLAKRAAKENMQAATG